MANGLDVDWQSRGSGPSCSKCGSNSQVYKAVATYTPKLRIPGIKFSHIPIGSKKTVDCYVCHNCDYSFTD